MKLHLIIILLIIGVVVQSQDLHLSQWRSSPMLINPGETGVFKDDYRICTQFRNQWRSIASRPYNTTHLAYDMPYEQWGMGAYILNNRSGTGNLNDFQFSLSGSYNVALDPKKMHQLRCGLQLGFIHRSVNVSNFVFDNQYTYEDGGYFNPALPSNETFKNTTALIPDVNFGVYYELDSKAKNLLPFMKNFLEDIDPYIGAAGLHLTSPKMSFFGEKNKLNPRWLIYGGSKYKIDKEFSVDPSILYMYQVKNGNFVIGAIGDYYSKPSDAHAYLGLHYRAGDAIIASIGGLYKNLKFMFSYDITISSLSSYNHYKGGFELSLSYTANKHIVAFF